MRKKMPQIIPILMPALIPACPGTPEGRAQTLEAALEKLVRRAHTASSYGHQAWTDLRQPGDPVHRPA